MGTWRWWTPWSANHTSGWVRRVFVGRIGTFKWFCAQTKCHSGNPEEEGALILIPEANLLLANTTIIYWTPSMQSADCLCGVQSSVWNKHIHKHSSMPESTVDIPSTVKGKVLRRGWSAQTSDTLLIRIWRPPRMLPYTQQWTEGLSKF